MMLLFLLQSGDVKPRDPFSENVPDTLTITLPGKGGQEHVPVEWAEKEHEFILVGRTREVRKALKEAGKDNVHELVADCLSALRCYYEFYQQRLSEERHLPGAVINGND